MISSANVARPYKSIPSPGSSQCLAAPWRSPTNQFHRPIQSRAPMARPHTQSHRPHPASVAHPWHAPTNQSHLPGSSPHDASPLINAIAPCQPVSHTPINQSHHPYQASVTRPYQSNPSPLSSQVGAPPCRAPMNQSHRPILPVFQGPMSCPHESIPSPRSRPCRVPPWINPISLIQPVLCAPMAQPHQSIPSSRSSRAPPWPIPGEWAVLLIAGLRISALLRPCVRLRLHLRLYMVGSLKKAQSTRLSHIPREFPLTPTKQGTFP